MKAARAICVFVFGAALLLPVCGECATTLVSTGAEWRYWDDTAAPPASWKQQVFDDAAWKVGRAQLGYGEGDETTVIASGVTRPVTTYFRHTFVVTQENFFDSLTLRLLRDDGAIVYLNGTEIYRSNMPEGFVHHGTPAVLAVGGGEQDQYFQYGVWPYYIQRGSNVIAVEVHQAAGGGADCSFDLNLLADLPLTPPTISLVAPEDGEIFSGGDLYLTTEIADEDGHVYLVQFFAGTQHIGSATSLPFDFRWTNPPPGRYALSAQAVDNSGRRGFAAPVHVQVGAATPARLVRGPFLQTGTTNSVIVCWRTDWFETSRVAFGTNAAALDQAASASALAIDHALRLENLQPDTIYYYSILGASNAVLAGGPEFFFRTAPATNRPVRVWVIGDSGTADINATQVRDAYTAFTGDRYTDVWLMLGDNAYETGTDEEYQRAVFEIYPRMLRQTVLWPTLGNHDAVYKASSGEFPYIEIFNLPKNGEAGGVPSGTEKYYSFDYANIHFVCLDSESSSRQPDSPMLQWLDSDLAATTQEWVIAFWHHPPYSWGTHDSDSELALIEMRQHVVPILEHYGVDLTFCGHSHNYERSYLINGHYGFSSDLAPGMVLDGGSGHESIDHSYQKPAEGLGANQGSVFAVCGCSGQGGFFEIPKHPAMRVAMTGLGSMVIDVSGDRLDAKFIRDTGEIDDQFTILKSANPTGARPYLQISRAGDKVRLSWPTSRLSLKLQEAEMPEPVWDDVIEAPSIFGRSRYLQKDVGQTNQVFRLRSSE